MTLGPITPKSIKSLLADVIGGMEEQQREDKKAKKMAKISLKFNSAEQDYLYFEKPKVIR